MSDPPSGVGGLRPINQASSRDPDVAKFHDLVNSDGLLHLGRNARLKDLATNFHSLSNDHVNAILDGGSAGDLREFGTMINAGGTVGGQFGLSDGERRTLFHDLAAKAGGSQLAKLSRALDWSKSSGLDVKRLAAAVAGSGNPQTRLDFVRTLAPDLVKHHTAGDHTQDSATTAVGTVLSNMSGSDADRGFGLLDGEQLAGLLSSGVRQAQYSDADYTVKLIDAAARGTSRGMMDTVYEAGSKVLADLVSAPDRIGWKDGQQNKIDNALAGLEHKNNTQQYMNSELYKIQNKK